MTLQSIEENLLNLFVDEKDVETDAEEHKKFARKFMEDKTTFSKMRKTTQGEHNTYMIFNEKLCQKLLNISARKQSKK